MKILRFLLLIVLLFNIGMSQSAIAALYIDCAKQSYIPKQECTALVRLYNSTNGSGWYNSSGWLNYSDPCTSWYGVECIAFYDGYHVYRLLLNGNNLSGSIPPEVDNLTKLNRLYLFGNQLSGSIPPEIGNMENLNQLYLYNNQLSGFIPISIGNITNLYRLYLYGNQLSGSIPSSIGNLANLRKISLSNNQLSGSIPESIGNLINLDLMSLYGNQLSGSIPPEIGNLTYLNQLSLFGNQLCGEIPTNLTNLINLYNNNGININNNYLYTNDATLDAFLIDKGGDWENSQGARCPADAAKTLLYQIIMGANQK